MIFLNNNRQRGQRTCYIEDPEELLTWLPKKDPTSKVSILMLVSAKEDGHAVKVYGARVFEGECDKENDGSATFESDIFYLTIDKKSDKELFEY